MGDNVLKKEFNQKDVQRVRNLVQGKYGEKVTQGVGYTKNKNHIKRVISGKKMVENGPLKKVSNKILQS